MPIYHRYRFIITTLVLTLFGCGQHDKIEIPEPIPAMTEQRKLRYSGRSGNYIISHSIEMSRRFKNRYKLDVDPYTVHRDTPFDEILEHYSSYFNQFEHWEKIDASELEWDKYSITHGWKSKNDIFLLFTHSENDYFHVFEQTPERERSYNPYFPVYSLTSL